jgi:hypothetical protein
MIRLALSITGAAALGVGAWCAGVATARGILEAAMLYALGVSGGAWLALFLRDRADKGGH